MYPVGDTGNKEVKDIPYITKGEEKKTPSLINSLSFRIFLLTLAKNIFYIN